MSERPWMPLWIGDYLADTQNLSTYEHGAYLLLLMYHWQHDKLPGNDQQLSRIARVHPPHWPRLKKVLMPFFDVQEDGSWIQKRIIKELIKADEISNKRRAAAEQMFSNRRANAQQMHTHSHSHSHKESRGSGRRKEEEEKKRHFVEVDTTEWKAWSKCPLPGKKGWPEQDFRVDGRIKRGWYFPTPTPLPKSDDQKEVTEQ
jgi:uncharacterized protein YdaU (DUF1376 family)